MKNQLIATLVGGIILFIWQFLSWSMLNIHGSEMAYTPNQDAVMAALSENLEPGQYFLPNIPPGASAEEQARYMEEAIGKPWATISYHESMSDNMVLNMIRGFGVNLVSVFLLVWILMKFEHLTLQSALLSSLFVGVIGYLVNPYMASIWFETDSIGHLVDAVVQWGAVGVWLGWYLPGR